MDPSHPAPRSLNTRRDAYTTHMRDLMDRVPRALPKDLDGILDRADSILAAQRPSLDSLDALDLDGESDLRETALVLLRSEQLPRMILCFGEVLVQEEKDQALRPLQVRCLDLARQLAELRAEWFMRHQDELELLDDDEIF